MRKILNINWKNILSLLLLLILTFTITYPSIFHLSDKLIGDGGDNYQNLAFQYIASQNIKNFQYICLFL